MTTVSLLISGECSGDNVNRQVDIATNVINNSCYFKDLLCFMQIPHDGSILFPPQYNEVVDVYLEYSKVNNHTDVVTHQTQTKVYKHYKPNKLKLAFELCHYLSDDKFLVWLIELALGMWDKVVSDNNNVIDSLHLNIQRDIYLHIPLCFVPITFQGSNGDSCCQQVDIFMRDWLTINKDKTYVVNDHKYKTYVEYYVTDDTNTISHVRKIECVCITPDGDYHYHGVVKYWHPLTLQGKKFLSSETYHHNGRMHGTSTSWYSTGHLKRLSNYNNGFCYGTDTQWWQPNKDKDKDKYCDRDHDHQSPGNLLSVVEFNNGVKHGNSREYYSNGQLEQQGCYVNGKMCGEWKLWYESGNIRCITTFNNNVRCGVYNEYYDTVSHHDMKEYHFDDEGEECSTFKAWWPPRSPDLEDVIHCGHEHSSTPTIETNQLRYCCTYTPGIRNIYAKYIEWDKQGNCVKSVNDNHDTNNTNNTDNHPRRLNVYKYLLDSGLTISYDFS